jgi:two-component system phosphate regulon sensor histidine kinase PhoR
VATALLTMVLVSLPIGVLFGAAWSLATFLLLLLALGVYHVRNLTALVQWSREPLGAPLPKAWGLWDLVFSDLNRLARRSTEQRQALAASLDQFRKASNAMPDGVMYLAADDSIQWLSQRAEQHFGLDGQRDQGSAVTNLVREPDFVSFLRCGNYAEPLVFHPARRLVSSLMVQAIPFGDGQKLILSRDITQIERLENMRRDFVANVSHELRTPLTVVSGFLETMRDGLDELSPDEMAHFLDVAGEQAARMQRLIEDLLSLSALETGAPEPIEERVDANALVEEVARDAQMLSAGRHQISCTVEGKVILRGCRKELRSAFANLASNAVRYTPGGGEIRLVWRLRQGGGEFSVSDTGIGIPTEHIPRLTERFYRVDRGRSRETGGTGLGLAIVKHVLTRHQAELAVSSEPGRGSTFIVRFPPRRIEAITQPSRS